MQIELCQEAHSGPGKEGHTTCKLDKSFIPPLYRTTTVAVDSHGKKGKKDTDTYSGKRTCKETGQKHAFGERKGGQTSPGIQGKNLVETSAAVHWRAWKKESQQSIRQGSKQGQSSGERSQRLRRASRRSQVFVDMKRNKTSVQDQQPEARQQPVWQCQYPQSWQVRVTIKHRIICVKQHTFCACLTHIVVYTYNRSDL